MATKTTGTTKKTGARTIVQTPAQKAVQLFNDIRSSLRGVGDDAAKWQLPPIDPKKNDEEPPVIIG